MAKEKTGPDKFLILYVGVDKRFCESIENKLTETYEHDDFELVFEKHHTVKDDNYLEVFEMIRTLRPDLVLLDYSFQPESMLKVICLVRQILPDIKVITLYDHQNTKLQKEYCLTYGVLINHLKSGEDNLNVVYSLSYTIFRKFTAEPRLTQYNLKAPEACNAIERGRISYFQVDGFKVDTKYLLKAREEIELDISIPENIMPSKKYIINKSGSDGAHYTHKKNWAILKYQYIDPIAIPQRATKLDLANIKEENEKRTKEIDEVIKPQVEEWFENVVLPKNTPPGIFTMIIDPMLKIMQTDSKELWSLNEFVRYRRSTDKLFDELNHHRPSILAVQLEEEVEVKKTESIKEGDEEKEKEVVVETIVNNMDNLSNLIKDIKKVLDYNPFLFVFNCSDKTADDLKSEFGFQNLIASKENITPEFLLKCIKMLENKNHETQKEENEGKSYISFTDPLGDIGFQHKIEIININELAFEFSSKMKFKLGDTFYMVDPISTYFTVVPHRHNSPFDGQDKVYRGIFHSYNNDQKNGIRQYVIKGK